MNHYAAPGFKPQISQIDASMNTILATVSNETGVSIQDIISPKRNKDIAMARHIFCKAARVVTPATLEKIASFICRKDHTTVRSSLTTIDNLMQCEPETRSLYQRVINKL